MEIIDDSALAFGQHLFLGIEPVKCYHIFFPDLADIFDKGEKLWVVLNGNTHDKGAFPLL